MNIIEKDLSDIIFKAALKVHKALGPGLLESAYQKCLMLELLSEGLLVRKEVQVDINYLDTVIENAYKIDLLVEDKIIIECKAIDAIAPVHMAQVMTYLRLSEKQLGILINFNVPLLKEGYKRIVL
jgi:GxxExxY protein